MRQHGVPSADPNGKIDQAFETMTHEHDQAVLGLQGAHFYRERGRIAELSIRYRLPGIFELFTRRRSREPCRTKRGAVSRTEEPRLWR